MYKLIWLCEGALVWQVINAEKPISINEFDLKDNAITWYLRLTCMFIIVAWCNFIYLLGGGGGEWRIWITKLRNFSFPSHATSRPYVTLQQLRLIVFTTFSLNNFPSFIFKVLILDIGWVTSMNHQKVKFLEKFLKKCSYVQHNQIYIMFKMYYRFIYNSNQKQVQLRASVQWW